MVISQGEVYTSTTRQAFDLLSALRISKRERAPTDATYVGQLFHSTEHGRKAQGEYLEWKLKIFTTPISTKTTRIFRQDDIFPNISHGQLLRILHLAE